VAFNKEHHQRDVA